MKKYGFILLSASVLTTFALANSVSADEVKTPDSTTTAEVVVDIDNIAEQNHPKIDEDAIASADIDNSSQKNENNPSTPVLEDVEKSSENAKNIENAEMPLDTTQAESAQNSPTEENSIKITKIEYKADLPNDEIRTYDAITVEVEFTVDNSAKGGKSAIFELPEKFRYSTPDNHTLELNHDGIKFADVVFKPEERTATLTLDKSVEKMENIKGGFNLILRRDFKDIDVETTFPVEIKFNGQVVFKKDLIYKGIGPKTERPFFKNSWQSSSSLGTINNNITVGQDGKTYRNITIIDDIEANSEDNMIYDFNSLYVEYGDWSFNTKEGWTLDNRQVIRADKLTIDKTEAGQFRIKIPSEVDGKGFRLVYQSHYVSPVNEGEQLKNSAILLAEDIEVHRYTTTINLLKMSGWIIGDKTKGNVVVNYISDEDGEVLKPRMTDTWQQPGGTPYNTDDDLKLLEIITEDGRKFIYIRTAIDLNNEAVSKNGKISRVDNPIGNVDANTTKEITYIYKLKKDEPKPQPNPQPKPPTPDNPKEPKNPPVPNKPNPKEPKIPKETPPKESLKPRPKEITKPKMVEQKSEPKSQHETQQLPKTGETTSWSLTVIGLAILGLILPKYRKN